jgi:eukaryotic-like serine/threonine-protein kinase
MLSEFGRYLILKKIAVGGMAEIFLARRVSMGQFSKFVVLKRLSPEYQGKRSFERLFLTEAKLTGRLSHPNIVQLNDLGQVDGSYFMAMEYIHGVSSAEMMSRAAQKRMPVPLGVALGVVLSTARALAYCGQALSHEGESLDLLHHDISPHNIQIRFDGMVKLLDFGVATQAQRQEGSSRRGKFAYMSPEAFNRMHLDQRSDLFSLGVVLYELTMGRRLFKGRTQQETKQKAEACVIPTPRSIHEKFPEILETLILKALSPDKSERFQSFEALILALDELNKELKIDCSNDRIARYLRELYSDEIEKRALQLQSLAARAEVIGSDPLDAINTLNAREQAPVNLSGKSIGNLPTNNGFERNQTPVSLEGVDRLFGKEVIEKEMVEGIDAEPTPGETAQSISAVDDLPQDFALLGERERDWDESRSVSTGRFGLLGFILVICGMGGAFYVGTHMQGMQMKQSPTTNFSITSTPVGATVSVGGIMWGTTPLEIEKEIDTKELIIQISKPGYEAQSTLVKVYSNSLIQVRLNLPRKSP